MKVIFRCYDTSEDVVLDLRHVPRIGDHIFLPGDEDRLLVTGVHWHPDHNLKVIVYLE